MISADDIDAFSDDIATAEEIVGRAQKGTTQGRHIHAQEEMALIRAYWIMRQAATSGAAFIADYQKRVSEGYEKRNDA